MGITSVTVCGYPVGEILLKTPAHFLLGFLVAYFVFSSTLTTRLVTFSDGIDDFSTFRWRLLVSLSCALLIHVIEDYTLRWF